MNYDYPEWSVNDAKSGLYKVGYKVVYYNQNGTANVYQVTSDYVGGTRTPDVETGWVYLTTITYDWSPDREYKIGSVVYFNNLKYIATTRYRGGNEPPNEEEDPDGIRTWMINYEDGNTPVSVFFYRKTFGFKTLDEAYPFSNYLEDISWEIVPKNQEGQISYEYDRFDYLRSKNANGQWNYPEWQRSAEQSYVNSVMEAHPYHPTYDFGYIDTQDNNVFKFYENAKHKSELTDKLFPYVTLSRNNEQGQLNALKPKRNIPFFNSYSLDYSTDTIGISGRLDNGVSIEYYPDIDSNEFDIICPQYFKARINKNPNYFLYVQSLRAISDITPIYCYATEVNFSYDWQHDRINGSKKMELYVEPFNTCVDNVNITFHFKVEVINCWKVSTPQDDDNGGVIASEEIKCSEPQIYYINRTFEYNENTRNSSGEFSPIFLGQPRKWVKNPDYDPNCVEPTPPPQPYYQTCPSEYIPIVDTAYPDTSLDFSNYASTTGSCSVKLIGWTLN